MHIFARRPTKFTGAEAMRLQCLGLPFPTVSLVLTGIMPNLLPRKGPLAIIVMRMMLVLKLMLARAVPLVDGRRYPAKLMRLPQVTVSTELLDQLSPRRRHSFHIIGSRAPLPSPLAFAESLRRAAMQKTVLLLVASSRLAARSLGVPFSMRTSLFVVPVLITSGPLVARTAMYIETTNTYSMMKVMM